MTLSKKSRRELLKISLGAGALGLLERMGLPMFSSRKAYAGYGPGSGKPTKLLTIYVPGGWSAEYMWPSYSKDEIAKFIPAFNDYNGYNTSAFYNPEQVGNADGSGDEMDGSFQKLRVPRVWDEENLKKKSGWDSNRMHGWAWGNPDPAWSLWNHSSVVHGVDTGSAGHRAAIVGMLSGIANANFIVPSVHARVAHAMSLIYGANRPLGNVAIGPRYAANILPSGGSLPAVAAPLHLTSINALAPLFSDEIVQYKTEQWAGLRNRKEHKVYNYAGEAQAGSIMTNDMEEYVLKDVRSRAGTANDALFEQIHASYGTVSKQLASDITSVIENSPGLYSCVKDGNNQCAKDSNNKNTPLVPVPYWANFKKHFGLLYWYNFDVEAYANLALQLLTSDLCSSVHLTFGGAYHDNHGDLPGNNHYKSMHQIYEQIGRLLAFMNMLPGTTTDTLLGETLVMVSSEFNRTLASSKCCDHWPKDSVCFAGGNVHGNRMIGGFVTEGKKVGTQGFYGKPVDMLDETGLPMNRTLRRMDIAYSAMNMMGLPNSFLPGGPGRILGLQKGGP